MQITDEPAFYFPLANGRYEVAAGLHRLEKDFGNGPVDQQIFQFDKTFPQYHDNKQACRQERLSKFYQEKDFPYESQKAVSQYLVEQLCREHPDKFITHGDKTHLELDCLLTGERLIFSKDYQLVETTGLSSNTPYTATLDAIANQVQEDLSVVQLTEDGGNYIAALHLCSPNHWAAEDKIGQSFIEAHGAVPHMEKLNQQSAKLLPSILDKGSYVRFAWGISTDTRLNHHPDTVGDIGVNHRQNDRTSDSQASFFIRVERQTLSGLPQTNTLVFTIRTYYYDLSRASLGETMLKQAESAIHSMSDRTLEYKGLKHLKNYILN
jgi:hypothetical protein